MSAKKEKGISRSAVVGIVALVFLIIGYQTALFVHSAAVSKIAANRDEPDTVYVYGVAQKATGYEMGERITDAVHFEHSGEHSASSGTMRYSVRKSGAHTPKAETVRSKLPRKVESFRFNPNTVSKDDLQRLGFSEKQAQSIINYREKGGKFRRKSDFAKSFVVSDSVYKRLEPYIIIPKTDLNQGDSAAFDALPGIGGWFASQMVAYRKSLGGYSYKEQLMDIKNFDQEKFDVLKDLIIVSKSSVKSFALWTLPADSLRKHPYIKNYETARSIVLFRENNPKENWTVENLGAAGILPPDQVSKLSRCIIADPTL